MEASIDLPTEVFDVEEFIRLSERSDHCRVKRVKEAVKLKLRTRRRLVTLKLDPVKAEEVLKSLKCKVVEA